MALVLGGCATKSDIRSLQTEISDELRILTARQDSLIRELRAATSSTQDTLATQSAELVNFRGDFSQQLRQIAEGLATLQALVGQNQQSIQSMRNQLAGGGSTGNVGVAPVPTGGRDVVPGAEAIAGVAPSAQELYDAARRADQQGTYGTAQRAYQDFLAQYPNHENAANAQWYLANILATQGQTQEAIAAYERIRTLHPSSERVPDALYRIGELQIDAGDRDAARETLQRLVNTYPEHPTARLAQLMLNSLS